MSNKIEYITDDNKREKTKESKKVESKNVSTIVFLIYAILLSIASAANKPGGYYPGDNQTIAFLSYGFGVLFANIIILVLPAYLVGYVLLRKKTVIRWIIAIIIYLFLVALGFQNNIMSL